MRKLLSILLLMLFSLPFVTPLFALSGGADSSLPACCRRNGVHHCTGTVEMSATTASSNVTVGAPIEKCRYCASLAATSHPNPLAPANSAAVFAGLLSHPAGVAQTESKWRIARDRSRQKRGPPAVSLL